MQASVEKLGTHRDQILHLAMGDRILCILFMKCFNDEIFENMFQFIQDADANGETVIIVCLESNVGAMGVILWFLMKRFLYFYTGIALKFRFSWVLKKSIEFIKFKIPEIQFKPQFL